MRKTVSLILVLTIAHQSLAQQKVKFKKFSPCTFSVELPANYVLKDMEPGRKRSMDYCDYFAKTGDPKVKIELHSMIKGRFIYDKIEDLYDRGINREGVEIKYKFQKDNWYVMSGIDQRTGNIVYWKKTVGENFIAEINIEYPASSRASIEPVISRISASFKCE